MARFKKSVFTNNPGLRGREGEHLVGKALSQLPSEYSFYEDLLLPSNRGDTTQIDHVVFSRFGVFVIETKNYSSWIFAGKDNRFWTQVFRGGRKHKFQNPLRQNYKHIKALETLTGLPPHVFYNIIVFTGKAEFKTPRPESVLYLSELISYIYKIRNEKPLTEEEMNKAITDVLGNTGQFVPELQAEHVDNLQEKHGKSMDFMHETPPNPLIIFICRLCQTRAFWRVLYLCVMGAILWGMYKWLMRQLFSILQ
ncbi:MAG: NERD domain-containing protein [Betaproteobacteria bacterium]|nr:NERD domain-containing protein [Betaproteobacteria bacterium]